MSTLLAYHHYRLKKQFEKTVKYVLNIIPIEDREVPELMFNKYDDITGKEEDKNGIDKD